MKSLLIFLVRLPCSVGIRYHWFVRVLRVNLRVPRSRVWIAVGTAVVIPTDLRVLKKQERDWLLY